MTIPRLWRCFRGSLGLMTTALMLLSLLGIGEHFWHHRSLLCRPRRGVPAAALPALDLQDRRKSASGGPGVASPGELQWHLERCRRGHPSQASCRSRSEASSVARPRIRSSWIASGRRTSNSGYLKQPTCSTSEPSAPAPPPVQANSAAITKGLAQASSSAPGHQALPVQEVLAGVGLSVRMSGAPNS